MERVKPEFFHFAHILHCESHLIQSVIFLTSTSSRGVSRPLSMSGWTQGLTWLSTSLKNTMTFTTHCYVFSLFSLSALSTCHDVCLPGRNSEELDLVASLLIIPPSLLSFICQRHDLPRLRPTYTILCTA